MPTNKSLLTRLQDWRKRNRYRRRGYDLARKALFVWKYHTHPYGRVTRGLLTIDREKTGNWALTVHWADKLVLRADNTLFAFPAHLSCYRADSVWEAALEELYASAIEESREESERHWSPLESGR